MRHNVLFKLLKEIDERRELERSYILRDQEALRQERINHQRKVELTEQSHQAKEASFREWEQTLMHERRQISWYSLIKIISEIEYYFARRIFVSY